MSRRAGVAEVAIAAIVIAVVAMLIVPLPRPLLDGLLTLNIGFAVILLMAALFTRRPLDLAAFPTILVVTTLFRVGLNVSTTRLILADADAGSVVRAFGTSVVAGNLIVGLVVFAVITIVQLVVVARGAERVAEVAARFALDAMPGKQLAIDAEQRAGGLAPDAARARRRELERESQLYGALDGAMRFVKGDAVAAILIVGINLVGGLVIGIGSRGMSAAEAMRTYSLLSIGEGLVAQIPSLLVAVAAGLLVTRVASAGDGGLGEDLATQLTGQPRALGAAAVLLLGLGLVPGLPLAPFALLGGVAALAAWALRVRPSTTLELDEPGADRRGDARGGRLALVVSAALAARLAPRRAALHEALAALRAGLTTRTGVALPPLTIVVGPTAGDDELAVHLDGVAVAWLALGDDPVATLAAELPAALAPLAPELLGLDRVAALVDQAARHAPVLVREVVPKVIALPALAEVLRGLAREQVPLDDLTAILEAIATLPAPAGGHAARDAAALVEQLRSQLRRQISARWAPRGQLEVFTVDAMIEDAVRTAIERRDGGAILALEPAIAQDIVAAIRARTGDRPAVILASADIRRHLRGLLEPELPAIAVLSAHELAPGTLVTTAGRIDVG